MTILAPSTRDTAEAAVLGAVLLTEKALDVIAEEHVRPSHFYRSHYAAVLHAMLTMREQGRPVDQLTLKAHFDSPQSPVSAADIELLAGSVPDIGNLRAYCQIVRESAWFDDARRATFDAQHALERRDRDGVLEAIAWFDRSGGDVEVEPDTVDEFMAWYDQDQKGWPLPYGTLTEAIGGGMLPGETTVIGSWSGFGKTFLLSQILRKCRKEGASVVEFASEMHGPKRTARTLTAMTGIPSKLIERKRLSPEQLRQVLAALQQLPYRTVASNGWPPEKYAAEIRRRRPDVAAIDTVSNLPCSRIDEWDRAATLLADAAAQAGTHLVQVFQLNLERDKGKRPPPVARDLRFGGTFYARARNVLFLHRDQQAKDAGDSEQIWVKTPDGHIRVDKATHGAGDSSLEFLPVTFNPRWLRFDELDQYSSRHLEEVA